MAQKEITVNEIPDLARTAHGEFLSYSQSEILTILDMVIKVIKSKNSNLSGIKNQSLDSFLVEESLAQFKAEIKEEIEIFKGLEAKFETLKNQIEESVNTALGLIEEKTEKFNPSGKLYKRVETLEEALNIKGKK